MRGVEEAPCMVSPTAQNVVVPGATATAISPAVAPEWSSERVQRAPFQCATSGRPGFGPGWLKFEPTAQTSVDEAAAIPSRLIFAPVVSERVNETPSQWIAAPGPAPEAHASVADVAATALRCDPDGAATTCHALP